MGDFNGIIESINGLKLNPEEEKVKKFIIAALKNDLIKKAKKGDEAGYYTFSIEDGTQYEIVFGKDPDKNHPKAERSLRSSNFGMRLERLQRTDYNVYIDPEIVGAPKSNVLKANVFKDNQNVDVKKLPGETTGSKYADILYIEIKATFDVIKDRKEDYRYLTVVDTILMEENEDANKYTYFGKHSLKEESESDNGSDKNSPSEDPKAIIGKRTDEINKKINRISQDQAKILEVLSKAEESNFYNKVLLPLLNCDKVEIGEISVRIENLIIGKISDKTFTYSVNYNENSVNYNEKNLKLDLTWNNPRNKFKADTELYIVADDDGFFSGLSYDSDNGRRTKLGDGCRLVIAKDFDGNDILTVASTEVTIQSQIQDYMFGIKNYAVLACDSEKYIIEARYFTATSDIVILNDKVEVEGKQIEVHGGIFHRTVCAEDVCTGKTMWVGDLTACSFLKKDGSGFKVVKQSKILRSVYAKYERKCCWCRKTVFCANDVDWKEYIKDKSIEGKWLCDDCSAKEGATYNTANIKYKLCYVYDENEEKKFLYPIKLDKDEKPFLADPDKVIYRSDNLVYYQCSHDKNYIIYNENKLKTCPTCQGTIGPKCYNEIKYNNKYKLFKNRNENSTFCNNCRTKYGKRIQEVFLPNTKYKVTLLAESNSSNVIKSEFSNVIKSKFSNVIKSEFSNVIKSKFSNVITCYSCNQKIYYDKAEKDNFLTCSICGKRSEKECKSLKSKTITESGLESVYLCQECKENNEVKTTIKELINTQNDIGKIVEKTKNMKNRLDELKNTLTTTISICGKRSEKDCQSSKSKTITESDLESVYLCQECKENNELKTTIEKLINKQNDIGKIVEKTKNMKNRLDELKNTLTTTISDDISNNKDKYLKYFSLKDHVKSNGLKITIENSALSSTEWLEKDTTPYNGTVFVYFSILPYSDCKYKYYFYKKVRVRENKENIVCENEEDVIFEKRVKT